MNTFKKNNIGLTLVELMVVIGIIAFLAVIGMIYFRTQIFKGYDAKRKSDIQRIGIAVEEYEKDHDCYPLSTQVTCVGSGLGLRPYLDRIPCDPVTQSSYYYEHEDSICPKWYKLYAKLDNEADNNYQPGIGPNGVFNYVSGSPNAPKSTSTGELGSGGGSSSIPQVNFYGCFSGVCRQIQWNPRRGNPECDPNFQNDTCYGQCSNPANECQSWE
jgi:type II secretory pathway pseudopilin PulG